MEGVSGAFPRRGEPGSVSHRVRQVGAFEPSSGTAGSVGRRFSPPSCCSQGRRQCCSTTDNKVSQERSKTEDKPVERAIAGSTSSRQRESTHYTHFLTKLGYRMGPTVGTGSYSKVKLAEKFDSSGRRSEKVACKLIDTRKASKSYATKFLPRELAIIRSINHPNLVKVKQIVDLGPLVCVFMEYGCQGDLLDYVQKSGPIFDPEARGIFKQIVTALAYLHGRGIAHRDLKCENVIRFPDGVIKLTDFGFARGFLNPGTGLPMLSSTFCGSVAYAAPEILQALPYDPTKYDMWSLGCILYIMMTARMPFHGDRSTGKLLEQQLQYAVSFPRGSSLHVPFACKKLIRDLLNPQPAQRPSAEVVLDCAWIKYAHKTNMLRGAGEGGGGE
ncbi:unnamed protein product [Notodromas monacha]|uniref:Protein kinase domain-containing protein n=1 Tax=Notodromas monacha TaxID=399045 RepID=A0A7R9BR75_9CRUS|nr:unnamed protein product [Notodromas monacha]CAG0919864.1 unnamed protein product [Notodromas monacha]